MAQTLAELNEHYAMTGFLAFREEHGLIFAEVTTPVAKASVCLQGAHVLGWQPKGQEPVLFLSAKSDMAGGKPIRGGIPVLFPWFGPRHDGKQGPMHGFARIQPWTLGFAALAGLAPGRVRRPVARRIRLDRALETKTVKPGGMLLPRVSDRKVIPPGFTGGYRLARLGRRLNRADCAGLLVQRPAGRLTWGSSAWRASDPWR